MERGHLLMPYGSRGDAIRAPVYSILTARAAGGRNIRDLRRIKHQELTLHNIQELTPTSHATRTI
jgi:hypothetical protein